jgi:small subunit ribosomal protein S20
VNPVPNIKSSIRSVKTDAERHDKNAPVKAAVRSAARKVETLAAAGKERGSSGCISSSASGLIDTAARKNVIHKNAASRKKSRLAKKVNAVK